MAVLTGIDLPYGSPGGSTELLRDLYLGPEALIPADVFMLAPDQAVVTAGHDPVLLHVPGKALSGPAFWSYVDRLSTVITKEFSGFAGDVIHLQHLTYGASPALWSAFPEQLKIALVHGTDLLAAAEDETQAQVLRQAVAAAAAIVVPTAAMADRLRRFAPVPPGRIVEIPWGIPDHLLSRTADQPAARHHRTRALYAGRLTNEKVNAGIFAAVASTDGIELTVAAPEAEYAALSGRADLSAIRYLGWLSREQLWEEFGRHDLLLVPSRKLEAFGLVAVEAQACGLPVVYQPVPGLAEVLGDSALAADFGDPAGLTAQLRDLSRSAARLADLAAAGRANSKRFPLSATAAALAELPDRLR